MSILEKRILNCIVPFTLCLFFVDKVQDNFLLVADSGRKGLYKLDLSGGNARRISLSRQTNPIAVAYDPVESKIYWTDVADKHIKRSNLDGTHEELIKSLHSRKCSIYINFTAVLTRQ